jgi:ribosomal protein S18 acetylase RimI-like enzyme
MRSDVPAIAALDAATFAGAVDALTEILHACVHEGASVSFILPFAVADARAFWQETVAPAVARGKRVVLVAALGGSIRGTVQIDLDTPPNQQHRAGILKLLVHPRSRGLGIGRALMAAAEQVAQRAGRSLITLDTVTGSKAEPLYRALGFELAGRIPGYSRDPREDRFDATSVMFKRLEA